MSKIILITGASSGIGKECAKLLNNSGYTVYGVARRTEKMEDIRELGVNTFHMDISKEDSITEGVNKIIEKEKRIDILINNAGFGLYGPVEDIPLECAKYQMEVNLFGGAKLIQMVLPYMRNQHYGRIINVSSVGGKIAAPLGGWYHASKFALEGLSDSLRLEVKPFGVDVILIEPSRIKTEWTQIALKNLKKVIGNTAYESLAKQSKKLFQREDNLLEPSIIAELIKKAIETRHPKARYARGYLAENAIFLKKWLSDYSLDRVIMKRLTQNTNSYEI